MIFLSMLSLFQILFLPGFLVLVLLRLNQGVIRTPIFSMGLSLLINYLLVLVLTLLHFYHRSTLLLIVMFEIIFLLIWFLRYPLKFHFQQDFKATKAQCVAGINQLSPIAILIFVLSCVTILFYLFYILSNFRPVFASTDPLIGWNEWARYWFLGLMPVSIAHFPQLLPANWSLTYLFINTSFIQLFIKLMSTIFPFAFLLLFFDLFVQTRNRSFLLALILSGYLLFAFLSWRVFSGFSDLPCMFFAALSLYTLFLPIKRYSKKQCIKLILLGSAFAAASALTKRAGLLIAVAYPFFVCWFALWDRPDFSHQEKIVAFIYSALLIFVLVFSSYGYFSFFGLVNYFEGSPHYIAYFQLSFINRFFYGLSLLRDALGYFNFYFLLPITLILGLIRKPKMIVLFLWGIFYFLVWALFFSYDLRNLTLILPVVGVISGFGLNDILSLKRINTFLFLLLMVLLVIFGINRDNLKNAIIEQQMNAQMQFGFPDLNKPIFSFFQKHSLHGTILTNYAFLKFLPGFRSFTTPLLWNQDGLKQQLSSLKPPLIFISKMLFAQTLHNQECSAKDGVITIAEVNRCNLTNPEDAKRLQVDRKLFLYKTIFVQFGYKAVLDNNLILMMQLKK